MYCLRVHRDGQLKVRAVVLSEEGGAGGCGGDAGLPLSVLFLPQRREGEW